MLLQSFTNLAEPRLQRCHILLLLTTLIYRQKQEREITHVCRNCQCLLRLSKTASWNFNQPIMMHLRGLRLQLLTLAASWPEAQGEKYNVVSFLGISNLQYADKHYRVQQWLKSDVTDLSPFPYGVFNSNGMFLPTSNFIIEPQTKPHSQHVLRDCRTFHQLSNRFRARWGQHSVILGNCESENCRISQEWIQRKANSEGEWGHKAGPEIRE